MYHLHKITRFTQEKVKVLAFYFVNRINFSKLTESFRSKICYSTYNVQSVHRELSDVTIESSKSNKARENASDQAVIRFSFIFD